MGMDYYMYHPSTGKCISTARYAGMPFLWEPATPYIHPCVVKLSPAFDIVEEWTVDENSLLYKAEMSKHPWERDDTCWLYCSKDDVFKLQDLMTANKTLLEEIMNNNDADGLIVNIW